jgi:hypothetical protein
MGISITDILGGSVLSSVKDLIGQFHLSAEDKAKMQAAVEKNAALLQQKEMEYSEKLNDIAGQNIRQETSSNDAFVRRARPAFLWAMTGALMLNIFLPLVNQFFGGHLQPIPIDAGLYGLFSSGFLGYTIARSYKKKNDKD